MGLSSCTSLASASASILVTCSSMLLAVRLASSAALAPTLVPSNATNPSRTRPASWHSRSTARNTSRMRATWRRFLVVI